VNGVLGKIEYLGRTWKGTRIIPGGNARIECIVERGSGEEICHRFSNKRVSTIGKAINTSDGQLPQRLEVIEIEEVPAAGRSNFADFPDRRKAMILARLR